MEVCGVKVMIFPSSHVWMRELNHKEGWAPKNWCLWTVVWRRLLKSPLDSKEIKPVNPKGNQSWVFIGRTDTPILWPPDAQNWFIRKDPGAPPEGRRRRGWQRMRRLDGIINSTDVSLSKLQKMMKYREAWHVAIHGAPKIGHDWANEQEQEGSNHADVWGSPYTKDNARQIQNIHLIEVF